MSDPMLERIARDARVPDLVDVLVDRLAQTDLQSLLVAVHRRRSARLSPRDVLAHYERSRLVRPASLDPQRAAALDAAVSSSLPEGYEVLELSPVAPLGTVTALSGLSQDVAVATVRGTEVVSDSTNVLALEAAVRRRHDRARTVRLASSHRVLRPHAPEHPGTHAHFRLVALVAAGGEPTGRLLLEQLDFYVRLVVAAGARDVAVRVTELDRPRDVTTVLARLRELHGDVDVRLDPERPHGRGYYRSVCFEVRSGETSLADGGFVDWTQRLLSDGKERLLISGAGLERLAEVG